jgi:beta-lactamase superfamily II metal-dependent hydrolase
MYEIDFLPVGDGENSGDAIALRYTNPETGAYVTGVIDAGFQDDGDGIVAHVETYFETDTIDFVLSTHPDSDHISGMGKVMRGLNVGTLLIHRPAEHGFPGNSGAAPAEELVALALEQNATVTEPFTGVHGFGGTLLIAGPTKAYYREMLAAQEETTKSSGAAPTLAERYFGGATATLARAARCALEAFPGEVWFNDAGGTNPRNNSAAIVSLLVGGEHFLLPSDAGVPAITQALDHLGAQGRTGYSLNMLALPHHGSRHNLDRETIERILGATTYASRGIAVASVSAASPNPSPRVANAAGRRGYAVYTTAGQKLWHHSADAPARGWPPGVPLPPLVEDDHD